MFVARSLRRMRNEPRQELVAGLKPTGAVWAKPTPWRMQFLLVMHMIKSYKIHMCIYIQETMENIQYTNNTQTYMHDHACMIMYIIHTNLAA